MRMENKAFERLQEMDSRISKIDGNTQTKLSFIALAIVRSSVESMVAPNSSSLRPVF